MLLQPASGLRQECSVTPRASGTASGDLAASLWEAQAIGGQTAPQVLDQTDSQGIEPDLRLVERDQGYARMTTAQRANHAIWHLATVLEHLR